MSLQAPRARFSVRLSRGVHILIDVLIFGIFVTAMQLASYFWYEATRYIVERI